MRGDTIVSSRLFLSCQVAETSLKLVVFDLGRQFSLVVRHEVLFEYLATTQCDEACISADILVGALDTALEWLRDYRVLPEEDHPSGLFDSYSVPLSSRIVSISIIAPSSAPFPLPIDAAAALMALLPTKSLRTQLCPSLEAVHGSVLLTDYRATKETCTELERALAAQMGFVVCPGVCLCPNQDEKSHISETKFKAMVANRLGTSLDSTEWPSYLFELYQSRLPSPYTATSGKQERAWWKIDKVLPLSSWVASILAGSIVAVDAASASSSGMFQLHTQEWDKVLLQTIARAGGGEANERARKLSHLKQILPTVGSSHDTISAYVRERYGFPHNCIVRAGPSTTIASFMSFLPAYGDLGLHLAHDDSVIVPTSTWNTDPAWRAVLSPVPLSSSSLHCHTSTRNQPFLLLSRMPRAGEARRQVRDIYSNSNWQVFHKVMASVSLCGGIGMDNKFFSVWRPAGLQGRSLYRFEAGEIVSEFSDLRANSRCLVEGQALQIRAIVGRIVTADRRNLLAQGRDQPMLSYASSLNFASDYRGAGDALGFDPFDFTLAPQRVHCWGKAASNHSIADCWSNVLGGKWVVDPADDTDLCVALGGAFVSLFQDHCAAADSATVPEYRSFVAAMLRKDHHSTAPRHLSGAVLGAPTGGGTGRSDLGPTSFRDPLWKGSDIAISTIIGSTSEQLDRATATQNLGRRASTMSTSVSPLGVVEEGEEEDSGMDARKSHESCAAATPTATSVLHRSSHHTSSKGLKADLGASVAFTTPQGSRLSFDARRRSSTFSDYGQQTPASESTVFRRPRASSIPNSSVTVLLPQVTLDSKTSGPTQEDWPQSYRFAEKRLPSQRYEDDMQQELGSEVSRSQYVTPVASPRDIEGRTGEAHVSCPAAVTVIGRMYAQRRIWPRGHQEMATLSAEKTAEQELLGLIELTSCDEDLWLVYGAMVEEYVRLSGTLETKYGCG